MQNRFYRYQRSRENAATLQFSYVDVTDASGAYWMFYIFGEGKCVNPQG